MTQKKLYLHIGYHKTGTSAIQRGLNENQHRLEQYGYYYPKSGRKDNKQLFSYEDTATMQYLRREMDAISQPNIIISNEWFSKNTAEEIAVLGNYLKGLETYIVVYLRKQDEYFQSWWTQRVKTGTLGVSFVDWIESFLPAMNIIASDDELAVADLGRLRLPWIMINANYYRYLNIWGEVFGHDHVLVRPYERSQLHPDILRDFLRTCGAPETIELEKQTQQVNVSPSSKTVEVIRNIAVTFQSVLPSTTKKLPPRVAVFTLVQRRAHEMGWNNQKLNYISAELHNQIMTLFEPSNQAVAEKYLGRNWLFQDPYLDKPVHKFEIEALNAAETIAFIGPILGEMTHRSIHYQFKLDQRRQEVEAYDAIAVLMQKLPVPRIVLKLLNRIVQLITPAGST